MSSNFGFTSFSNLGSIVQQVQQVASQVSTHNIILVNSVGIRKNKTKIIELSIYNYSFLTCLGIQPN